MNISFDAGEAEFGIWAYEKKSDRGNPKDT